MALTREDYFNLKMLRQEKPIGLRKELILNDIYYFSKSGSGFEYQGNTYAWGQRLIAVECNEIPSGEIFCPVEPVKGLEGFDYHSNGIMIEGRSFFEGVYSYKDEAMCKELKSKQVSENRKQFLSSSFYGTIKCRYGNTTSYIHPGDIFVYNEKEYAYYVWKGRHRLDGKAKPRSGYEQYPEIDFLSRHSNYENGGLNSYLPSNMQRGSQPQERKANLGEILFYMFTPQSYAGWKALGIMLLVDLIGTIFVDRVSIWIFSLVVYVLYNVMHK